MVFKFERKSTEKKCEKRKIWRLLWKKIRNNINLAIIGIDGTRIKIFRHRNTRTYAGGDAYVCAGSYIRKRRLMHTYV